MFLYYLAICFALVMTWIRTISDVHKFQQFGYYANHYLSKTIPQVSKWLRPYHFFYFSGIALVFLAENVLLNALGICLLLLNGYFYYLINKAYPAKKKLVFTSRVKRMLVTSAILMVLIGFIWLQLPQIYQAIIGLFIYPLSYIWLLVANFINKPIEHLVNQYYYNDALKLLSKNPKLIVIGVTGSYGKTSTKNVLYAMLSKNYNVLMTPESFNTKMGLTRTIREHLRPTHQILIAEMGAKEVGDIKELCEFVKPNFGVITSIGPQHLDTFKTFENIISTKGELFKYLEPHGTAFVNMDDENVKNIVLRDDIKSVKYGLLEQSQLTADYTIEAITVGNNGSSFTLVQNNSGKKVRLNTKLLGKHNLSNVLAGASIALTLGIPMDRLGAMTADLKPVDHRLSIRRVNDLYTVLDDAFNSNPVGSKMALEVLKQFEGNKKIVITPGMIELGDQSHTLNKAFGEHIADACDFVILVGKNQTKPIWEGLMDKKYPEQNIYVASSIKDGFRKLSEIVRLNDVVLIENDLPDTFNE